ADGLFDFNDVREIFFNNLTYTVFSLEQPNTEFLVHPFQEMKYSPVYELSQTNYLYTLLHADYILKMISTGMKICSKRPFQISNEKHFLKRLPQRLQSEFVSIYKQKSKNVSVLPRIHRFWIESDDYIFVDADYTQS
ncbi:unnamed protein product, partial [Didymodactylos carnosus]